VKWWIYVNDEVSDRPYSKEEIAQKDNLGPETLVCREGSEEWKKAREIRELQDVLQTTVVGCESNNIEESNNSAFTKSKNKEYSKKKEEENQLKNFEWKYATGIVFALAAGIAVLF